MSQACITLESRTRTKVPAGLRRSGPGGGEIDRLFEENTPLAKKLAGDFAGTSLPRDEALQEAMIGLYSAALCFDPSRGYRFSTYAWSIIRRRLRKALTKHISEEPAVDPQAIAERFKGRADERGGLQSVNLSPLPAIEREVIQQRFGIDRPQMSLQEIGDGLGLTRERVRQIEKSGIDRLRRRLRVEVAQ